MPRSFLLKKYYPRNDDDPIYPYLNLESCLSPVAKSTQSQLFSSAEKLKWNYEYEKSYWFDTSVQSSRENKHDHKVRGQFHHVTVESINETVQPRSQTTIENIKSFIATMIQPCNPQRQHALLQLESAEVEERTTVNFPKQIIDDGDENDEKEIEVLIREKADNHYSQIDNDDNDDDADDDDDVTVQKVREFLENNTMFIEEVIQEIGIDGDDLNKFVRMRVDLSLDEKHELLRWYTEKMGRVPPHQTNTTSEESYTCKKCGKIFTYKSYLERHIKYVCPDSTGRSWKCNYCGKAFQYPCYLRRHVRSHTGESPYKCDKCDRAFVRSTDLQRHIRNHTGEKPYSCSQCARAFARSTDLKRHMRTHTGEKPYKCWKCGKSFSQSGSLQTHVHTHTKEQFTQKVIKKL